MKINPTPWFLRFFSGWKTIKDKVDFWAKNFGVATYSEQPTDYRFEGWGTVGFPPRLACNVKHIPSENDLGRMVG